MKGRIILKKLNVPSPVIEQLFPTFISSVKAKTVEVEREMEFEEIRVKLSLGEIAGKWYGSKERRPIILIHGWQDNAGSYATLIPLLSPDFSYFAIDLPGHGLSSRFPKGWNYHTIDYVSVLEQLRQKFKWERLSIMAHSMGAIISFMYATTFPSKVDLVCAIDTLKPQQLNEIKTTRIYLWRLQRTIDLDNDLLESPPNYGYDEFPNRVVEGSLSSIDLKNAEYLIERGAAPTPKDSSRFYFTRDIRAKFIMPFYMNQKTSLELIKRIEAAYLFIRGSDRLFSESEKNINEAVQQFRKFNKHFELMCVNGTHHLHLNQPEIIAEKINQFFKNRHISEPNQSDQIELKCKL